MRGHGEDVPYGVRSDNCLVDDVALRDQELLPTDTARSLAENVISRLTLKASWAELRAPIPEEADIDAFCDALLDDDPATAAALIARLRAEGASPDTIYLGYVGGAARRFGERWIDDTATFMDVTLGLSRLHRVLHDLGPAFFTSQPSDPNGHEALLAPVPGETHVLGVVMATDFFRRQGWRVDMNTAPTLDTLRDAARTHSYDMIGLSASCRPMVEPLRETVGQLRIAAPGALIVIGGHITQLEPDIAGTVGADCTAGDAPAASVELQRAVKYRRK